VGCVLGRDDWLDRGQRRGNANIAVSVDDQGGNHEQAVRYVDYMAQLVDEFARTLAACGRAAPPNLDRLAKLRRFVAHSLRPDGRYEQLGDTYAQRPDAAVPTPASRYAVYRAGFVFWRSAWAPTASFYSLRFGPPRRFHGHHDHTALTYVRGAREWLIDAGTAGYRPSAARDWERTSAAHNVVVAEGAGRMRNVETRLRDSQFASGWQSYRLEDEPYDRITRSRRVLHVDGPEEFLLVVDRLRDTRDRRATYRQLWHLPQHVTAARPVDGRFTALSSDGARRFHVLQLEPATSMNVVKGAASPRQGWRSRSFEEHLAAPTAVTTVRGDGAEFVTVMTEAAAGRPVGARIVRVGRQTRVRVVIGSSVRDVVLGASAMRPLAR
jgi:hypothetical protein